MRLRRSLLWVSGYDTNKLRAAIDSEVDAIVIDLEDGVTVPQKPQARACTYEALKNWDFKGKERIVRVNGLDTPYFKEDLEQVLIALPDAIRLPKCESVEYVLEMDRILGKLEDENGLRRNSIEIILMIETALGIMRCYEMATCCPRVTAMGVGMEDLTASMGVARNYELRSQDLLYARQKLVLEGKAAGIQVLDSGVLFNGDLDFYRQDCLNDKRDGFEGRSVSDLNHISIVNEAFSPTEEEISWAKRIIAAYDKAVAECNSDVVVDGKFVDPPVVTKAEAIMTRLERIQAHVNKK